MPPSPLDQSAGVLRLSVQCDGSAAPDTVQVFSCLIRRSFNAIAWARLVLVDGDMPTGDFAASDSALFVPGAVVTVSAGYGDSEEPIFEGVVLRHGVSISRENRSSLTVECRDKAGAMTLRRHDAVYLDQTDDAVMKTLISAYPGLSAAVDATSVTHAELVQHNCSDWDFLVARAEANGMLVSVTDGAVAVKAPDASASSALSVAWGTDLIEFQADMDARDQLSACQAAAWDPKNQALVEGALAQPQALNQQGDLSGSQLAQVVGGETLMLKTHTVQDKDALDAWGKAVQVKASLARIQGRMTFQGSALAKVGGLVDVHGVGARFSGTVFVGALEHDIRDGNWTTTAEFGLAPDWQVQKPGVMAPPAAGLLPGVNGLQIGVVLKLDGDPAGENRIQIQLPVAQTQAAGVWARIAQGYASNGFGAFFLPEIGDEVIVGYFNDDPCHPVVLGGLYSSAHVPPYALQAGNDTKAIVTRFMHKLEFDEKAKKITLTTPGGNTVILDDGAKSVTLQDQNGNSATLSGDGIVLDSPKDIKITAKGGITLDAVGAVTVSSKADAKISGMNVACEGQVGFTGKGSATAELSASGQTTVKGAMVMIN